ncbi:hypothetical protein K3495_g12487 [Podosphaera aphanis]|nr:hypothetical protein K3495_g12487 [Podosphaera aphanis]
MNAQISFVKGHFNIIHIPLDLFSDLFHPILRVLLPHGGPLSEDKFEGFSDNEHNFLNISVTPTECSVICHSPWARDVFLPAITRLSQGRNCSAQISKEPYIVFNVSTVGTEAGQRVIDLTAPLALAGVPIFFITTYYSDFVIVPSKDRPAVVSTLLERGFEFSDCDSAYAAPAYYESCQPSDRSDSLPNQTPSNLRDLQNRTFSMLKERKVIPFIEPDLYLVHCSARERSPRFCDNFSSIYNERSFSAETNNPTCVWLSRTHHTLYLALISVLSNRPRFLSLTLAFEDGPSLLIDKELTEHFGDSITSNTDTILVPIFLNLKELPLESTGIICGVAGLLVQELCDLDEDGGAGMLSQLGYLSTAKAGAVILGQESSSRALDSLSLLLEKDE